MSIELTEMDRVILDSYTKFAGGLSNFLGESCEILVHCLEDYDHSVIKIFNGFHTGRKEGAPITDLALSLLKSIQSETKTQGLVYFSKNKKGEPLKSTTISIRGENNRIIGLMCINFFMNTPIHDILKILVPTPEGVQTNKEIFAENSADLIVDSVVSIQDEVMHDESISLNNKNKEIIRRLNENGIFNLKDSVSKIAEFMNISKNTVYLHLRNLTNNRKD